MIEQMLFGRTGHLSTRAIFGAAAFGGVTQAEADRSMELLFEYGVNHIDTAASYGNAEERIGPWMPRHRQDFFLASKTEERTYQAAYRSILRSLERLQTDHLDLLQLHAVIEDDEWEVALGPGGALEAAVAARQEGLVRFIGITSHSLKAPAVHLKSLERFDFDSVLLPFNYMLMQIPSYADGFNALRAVCQTKNVALQCIKTNQRRPWADLPRDGKPPSAPIVHRYDTWYEPFDEQWAVDLAVHYAMAQPGIFLNTSGDVRILPKFLKAASRYEKAPSLSELQQMLSSQEATPLWEA